MEEQTKKLGRPSKAKEETQENKEKVVVDAEVFSKMQSDIELLKKVANRYRLEEQEALAKRNEKGAPRGHLKRLNGKLVVKWLGLNEKGSKAEQKILYQGTTPVGEVLIGHYKTIEDEDIVCEAVKFYRSTDIEQFTKIGQEGDDWVIKFDNQALPQEYKINLKFVNP